MENLRSRQIYLIAVVIIAGASWGVQKASAWFAALPDPDPIPYNNATSTPSDAHITSYSGLSLSSPSSNILAPIPTPTQAPYPGESLIIVDERGNRFRQQTVTIKAFYWMLLSWRTNKVECDIYIDHGGQPTSGEIQYSCGGSIHKKWESTPACSATKITSCKGLYLHYVGRQNQVVDIQQELPKPTVEITTPNCQPSLGCTQLAQMHFSGVEPLPEYKIKSMHYSIDGVEYACPGVYCLVTMPITGERGQLIEVWAASTLGDESVPRSFRVRNVLIDGIYQFELLGEQWAHLAPSCSLEWDRLPPLDTAALTWLESPPTPDYLASSNRFALLAGQLIWSGQVDASSCEDGGLLPNRAASPCGESLAAELVLSIQNQYDPAIFIASNRVGIPPRLIKGVLGQESQFWPDSDDPLEFGMGRITDQGLDMLLTHNLPYFLKTCSDTLDDDVCASGYDSLTDSDKAMLRGVALSTIGTNAEIVLIAEMLKAGCSQVARFTDNILDGSPGEFISYEDLWAMTLATYHAGAGCVAFALEETFDDEEDMIWSEIADRLEGVCERAREYVDRVYYLGR